MTVTFEFLEFYLMFKTLFQNIQNIAEAATHASLHPIADVFSASAGSSIDQVVTYSILFAYNHHFLSTYNLRLDAGAVHS